MANFPIADQYLTKNMGPLASKMLVKTYDELLDKNTWIADGKVTAYNGMLVAVWLNKKDPSRNGVYLLQDPNITSALKYEERLDVTQEAHWHKLTSLEDLANYAKTSDVVGIKAFEEFIASNSAAIQELNAELINKASKKEVNDIAVLINSKADASTVADLITSVATNTDKLEGITTTVKEAIEAAILTIPKVGVATDTSIGGIKSGTGDNKVLKVSVH